VKVYLRKLRKGRPQWASILRRRRGKLGLSFDEVGALVGRTGRAIRGYESAYRTPDVPTYLHLLDVLGIRGQWRAEALVAFARARLGGLDVHVNSRSPETYIRASIHAAGLTGQAAEDAVSSVLEQLPLCDRRDRR